MLLCILLFGSGFALGFLFYQYSTPKNNQVPVYGLRSVNGGKEAYTLINPLVGFDMAESKKESYLALKNVLNSYIEDKKTDEAVQIVSVYFRNLANGQWIGINENEEYDSASLFKLPVMMEYYSLAETNPKILEKKLKFTDKDIAELNKITNVDLESTLQKNTFYSVDELITAMIVRSDNMARYLLLLNSPTDPFLEIFRDLGLNAKEGNYKISPKMYSLLLRALYNSTILSHAMSEKALELLVRVDYGDGLRAGLPPSVKLAQKFGRYWESNTDGTFKYGDLHDCGIVYYTLEHPYLLCIMTRGVVEETKLASIIKDISKLTYDFVSKNSEMLNVDQ